MNRHFIIAFLLCAVLPLMAQQTLTLQDCQDMAMHNNKQVAVARLQTEVAKDVRSAAKTKYLPRVDAVAGYTHTSKELSLLNNDQKSALSNLGTNLTGAIGTDLGSQLTSLVEQGLISQEVAQKLGQMAASGSSSLAQAGNNIGQSIRDAFRTNTKNIYAGYVGVVQPVYMGGAIRAANDMARIGEDMAWSQLRLTNLNVRYAVENAYWLAVSLKNKQKLAQQYLDLVTHLNSDVQKMLDEGVATRSDKLKVEVAKNTAEVTLTQVENGVSLSKMALCQLIGLPLDGNITLADEAVIGAGAQSQDTLSNRPKTIWSDIKRPELELLESAVGLGEQSTKLVRSLYLPHVAVTGGVLVSNPNTFNGFEQKFSAMWNVGVLVQVPILNWGESKYRLRTTRNATTMAKLQLENARSLINLEIEQSNFKVSEAQKRLEASTKNMAAAEENLRCANVGFREGVMTVTDVMTAQTAWQKAKSQMLDAEIEVRVAQAARSKAYGWL